MFSNNHFIIFASLFILLRFIIAVKSQSPSDNEQKLKTPVIQTNYGKIIGKKVKVDNSDLKPVIQYLGIPYAKPPVGNRRWKKTEDINSWSNVLNASTFKAVCPQNQNGPLPKVLLPIWYRPDTKFMKEMMANMSEDCLYLNIYVPAALYDGESSPPHFNQNFLPVMVYFHGYTYSEGSGNLYDGSVLASYGEVIVVTFNYRLGVLGFLSTMDEKLKGNYGLWDQIHVLKWVSENIKSFGGDKKRVTVFGSGSGAASADILMLSSMNEGNRQGNLTKGYFQRAILQSGTALAPWSIVKDPRKSLRKLAGDAGCYDSNMNEMVNCLRNKTWKELLKVTIQPKPYDLAFGPVIDKDQLLKDNPYQVMEDGEFLNYDVLIGVSQGDGFGYVRDRLVSPSFQNFSSGFNYLSSKGLYRTKNFDVDVASFVDTFYKTSKLPTQIIRNILEFVYTDWVEKDNSDRLKASLMNIYTDRQFVQPAVLKASFQLSFNYPAYFYTFYCQPGVDHDKSWIKSAHGEQIPYVLGAPLLKKGSPLFPYNFTDKDRMISQAVMIYWTNFAKTGNPAKEKRQETEYVANERNLFKGIEWPRYNASRYHLRISKSPSIYKHYRSAKVEFWRAFLPGLVEFDVNQMEEKESKNLPSRRRITNPTNANSDDDFTKLKIPTAWQNQISKEAETTESSMMSLQMSLTLAVGFVLLFVNIIAFAVVSYKSEKHQYNFEKLKNEAALFRKKYWLLKNESENVLTDHGFNSRQEGNLNKDIESKEENENLLEKRKPSTLDLRTENTSLSQKVRPATCGQVLSLQNEPLYRTLNMSLSSKKPKVNGANPSLRAGASECKNDLYKPTVSVSDILRPEKVVTDDSCGRKVKNPNLSSDTTGTSGVKNGVNRWSCRGLVHGNGIYETKGVNAGIIEGDSERFSHTLPKKPPVCYSSCGNESHCYDNKPADRCQSALGMLTQSEHNSSSQDCYSSYTNPYFFQRHVLKGGYNSNAACGDTSQYQSVLRPRYYGSVQNIPPRVLENACQCGRFTIPRNRENNGDAVKVVSLAYQHDSIQETAKSTDVVLRPRPKTISTFSSVTTKL